MWSLDYANEKLWGIQIKEWDNGKNMKKHLMCQLECMKGNGHILVNIIVLLFNFQWDKLY